MALSCPPTIPVEFSTLQISSGRAVPYYQSIKRSKLPARTTKPAFDRSSEQLLVVAIKALGGVFLQGLTGRLWPAPTLNAGCQHRPAHCILMLQECRTATSVYFGMSNFFAHVSSLWPEPAESSGLLPDQDNWIQMIPGNLCSPTERLTSAFTALLSFWNQKGIKHASSELRRS